jgi:alanyl-tRNA synthetase
MQSDEIRQRFLAFFEKRGHEVIPSAPLVPENDPSVLFNTAGMQPLVPYLMGEVYPTKATRLVNAQKCVRTGDIDEIGDSTHLTFFEMLGNWSLGDYFKREAIEWSYTFLTSVSEGLGLDPKRLYVTVFEGDENAPRDNVAYETWKKIFESEGLDPDRRIFFMGVESNWWSPGENGPCGPDSEMFYDVTGELNDGLTSDEFVAADERQAIVEVWNDVFMEFEKRDGKVIGKLSQQNVDTGSGLERITAVVQGKDNVFETDLFQPTLDALMELGASADIRAQRIVADHMRASVFLIADGVLPSNTDQGYVLRRLIRRALLKTRQLGVPDEEISGIARVIIDKYAVAYPNLLTNSELIQTTIDDEVKKFGKTIVSGQRELMKIMNAKQEISGKDAFDLYQTHGYPLELTKEVLASMKHMLASDAFKDEHLFFEAMAKHQELSRTSSAGKFKGGLANTSDMTVALHTSTHLMLAGLRKYLGEHVHQAGSNITEERTRFDFTHPEKVSREILDQVEEYVNNAIQKGCSVTIKQMPKEEARRAGVEGSFWEKYPDTVNVYTVSSPDGTVFSQELCGGPHVQDTSGIHGVFKIVKEEASSAGVRRIKAKLVDAE